MSALPRLVAVVLTTTFAGTAIGSVIAYDALYADSLPYADMVAFEAPVPGAVTGGSPVASLASSSMVGTAAQPWAPGQVPPKLLGAAAGSTAVAVPSLVATSTVPPTGTPGTMTVGTGSNAIQVPPPDTTQLVGDVLPLIAPSPAGMTAPVATAAGAALPVAPVIAKVPEPAVLTLLVIGALGLAWVRRRS